MSGQWCNACQIRPEDGCRHPLGTECCPHRQSSLTIPKLPKAVEDFADTVLRYRPKPKSEPAKQRKRKAAKFAVHQYPDPHLQKRATKTAREQS